jgi:Tol biopolymer transport system component
MRHFAILLAVVSLAAAPAVEPGSSPSRDIAFAAKHDGNWEIQLVSRDGGQRTRLAVRAEQTRFPLWSPDGSKLAFGVLSGATWATWALWVMNADGSGATRIADSIVAKAHRQWTADGTRIILERMRDGHRVIVVARADGGGLTTLADSHSDDRDATLSPDGSRIAFTSSRDGRPSIWLMRADGSVPTRLTTGAGEDMSPTWSPDGATIAFVSTRDGGSDVYRVRPDGTALERLTVGAEATRDPSQWSPDGRSLAIQTAHGKNYDVELVRVADRTRTPLAASSAYDGQFVWSPDGRSIAFISDRDGVDALYVADASGGNVRRLTSEPSLNPAWRP